MQLGLKRYPLLSVVNSYIKKVLAISFSLIEAHICKYTYCHYFEQLICRGLL